MPSNALSHRRGGRKTPPLCISHPPPRPPGPPPGEQCYLKWDPPSLQTNPTATEVVNFLAHCDRFPQGEPYDWILGVAFGDAHSSDDPHNKTWLEVYYDAPEFECDDYIEAIVTWPDEQMMTLQLPISVKEPPGP